MIRRTFRHFVRQLRAWRNRPQLAQQAAQKIAQRLDTIQRGLL